MAIPSESPAGNDAKPTHNEEIAALAAAVNPNFETDNTPVPPVPQPDLAKNEPDEINLGETTRRLGDTDILPTETHGALADKQPRPESQEPKPTRTAPGQDEKHPARAGSSARIILLVGLLVLLIAAVVGLIWLAYR